MTEGLEIRKGGILVETRWVWDDEKDEGEYKEFDVTQIVGTKLLDICTLQKGITLRDIFLLVNKDLDFMSLILRNWTDEYVPYALSYPIKLQTGYDPDTIEYLELEYTPESGPDGSYGFLRPDFGGVGWELKDDVLFDFKDKDGNPIVQFKKGTRINWGLMGSDIKYYIDLPIKLSQEMKIYNGDLDDKQNYYKVIANLPKPSYTLLNILDGIFWEISFHGGPEQTKRFKNELSRCADEAKSEVAKSKSTTPEESNT